MAECKLHDICHSKIEEQAKLITKLLDVVMDAAFGHASQEELKRKALKLLVDEGFAEDETYNPY